MTMCCNTCPSKTRKDIILVIKLRGYKQVGRVEKAMFSISVFFGFYMVKNDKTRFQMKFDNNWLICIILLRRMLSPFYKKS